MRGAKISGWPVRSSPKFAKSARMPMASSTPRPSPRVEPTIPTTNASSSTERITCRLEAPSARSSASSRLRCATRIENVLTIRKPPTTSEMPAKISRKVRRKLIASSRSEAASSAALSPVTASYPSGSASWTSSRSWVCETPSAVTQMSENSSLPPRNRLWAVAVSKAAYVAPLSDPPSGKSGMPTQLRGDQGLVRRGDDVHLVAEVVARALGGLGVEHHLVRPVRGVALGQREPGEPVARRGVGVVAPDRRRALAADDLVVLVDDVDAEGADPAVDPGGVRDVVLELLDHRRGDADGRGRAAVAGVGRADHDVADGRGEDRGEAATEGVGEDQRAADERDAEHDRERAHQQAHLAPQQALEGCLDHDRSDALGGRGHPGHDLQHGSRSGSPQLVDDPAVGQEHARGRCTPPRPGRG